MARASWKTPEIVLVVVALFAGARPLPCSADMDVATLKGLVERRELGLTDAETQDALAKLNGSKVQGDLNRVRSAREAASDGLHAASDSPASCFDGSMRCRSGSLSSPAHATEVPPAGEMATIDPKTGKPRPKKVVDPKQEASVSSAGQCAAEADAAIGDLKSFIKSMMQGRDEDEIRSMPFGDFFLTLGRLFFPDPSGPGYRMPTVTTGTTVDPNAIATFHPGNPGLITFDCDKFPNYGFSMRRKIACHEWFHWYQGLGREYPLEEPSAYAVMPHC